MGITVVSYVLKDVRDEEVRILIRNQYFEPCRYLFCLGVSAFIGPIADGAGET